MRVIFDRYLPSFVKSLGAYSLADPTVSSAVFRFLSTVTFGRLCPSGSETCDHISWMYGPLWQHENLNEETHANLRELFGFVNLRIVEHLADLVRANHKEYTFSSAY